MANGSSRNKGRRGGAVSGPGALSKRTDLNVSSDDAREMLADAPMGSEQELVQQVVEGNQALNQSPQGVEANTEQPTNVQPVDQFDLAGPTNFPDMSITDRGMTKSRFLEEDSMMLIRAMAEIYPTPELLSLLNSQGSVYSQTPDDDIAI
mgnify:FL=1